MSLNASRSGAYSSEHKGSFKPAEVEELIDLYFHRPLAQRLVDYLSKTSITPNQVTVASGLTGVASGVLLAMSIGHPVYRIAAAVLLFGSVILDCSDGQLARTKKITSTRGALLDGAADQFVGASTFIGATYLLVELTHQPWLWLLGTTAAVCTYLQCALYDKFKLVYLHHAGFGYTEREDDLDVIARTKADAVARGDRLTAFLFWVYEIYTRAQKGSQSTMRRSVESDPQGFRAKARHRMRIWSFLGVGMHYFIIYCAELTSYSWPMALLGALIFIVTAMNILPLILLALRRVQSSVV